MAPKAIPKRLTTAKFAGPKVDIYVGPESKHFHLPKDILCYYSTYSDRCFNGGFKEAKEQKLTLPEDRVEYFQHLLDYMFLNGGEAFTANGGHKQQMKYCIEFIKYAGKYDLPGAVQIISAAFKDLLKTSFQSNTADSRLAPEHIATVFTVLPDGHELRGLVAVLALKFGLVSGLYESQEKSVEGFSIEVLRQLRKQKNKYGFKVVSDYFEKFTPDF